MLAHRVDALVLAFKLANPQSVDDEFDERQAFCELSGCAELNLGGLSFQLTRNRTPDRFAFQNADARCLYDRRAAHGWQLGTVVRAPYLATHHVDESFALTQRVACAVGGVHGSRGRRVDLCADLMGFSLNRCDADGLAVKRARIDGFITYPKDVDEVTGHPAEIREHLNSAKRVTGFTIAPGNIVMARIYDKTAELRLSGREEKRLIEEEIWRRAGWRPGESVTRVEFQFRGAALDDFDVRDPSKLRAGLDSLWQHGVRNWLRLVLPGTDTRLYRCRLDPRWAAVTTVTFDREAEPATRQRIRGGASSENVVGTVVSRLGGTGRLSTALRDAPQRVATMSPEESEQWLRDTFRDLFKTAADDAFETFIIKHGAHQAAVKVATKIAGTRARFWSVDDLMDGLFDEPDTNGGLHG